jgi:hypothetical protein
LANLFRHRVFSKRFTLPDAIAVIADGLVLVIEIIPKHVFRIFRCPYGLGSDHRHFAEIVDLPRENQRMIEVLFGVYFELAGDVYWAPVRPGNRPRRVMRASIPTPRTKEPKPMSPFHREVPEPQGLRTQEGERQIERDIPAQGHVRRGHRQDAGEG